MSSRAWMKGVMGFLFLAAIVIAGCGAPGGGECNDAGDCDGDEVCVFDSAAGGNVCRNASDFGL